MNDKLLGKLRRIHGHIHDWIVIKKDGIAKCARKYRNRCERHRLKVDEYTIISNTCIGGVICHDMGKRFMSPTVNIYIRPKDFVSFCEKLEYYLDLPLIEVEYDEKIGYPVAMLGDLTLYCKHYGSFQEVVSAWEQRKERIRWDRLYFMMTDRDFIPPVSVNKEISACTQDVIERFDRLPYGKKVCIVQNEQFVKKYSSCKRLRRGCQGNCVGIITNIIGISGKRMYQYVDDFDYISFLNGE